MENTKQLGRVTTLQQQQDQWHLKPRKDIKLNTSKIKIGEHICYIKGETTPITTPKNIAIANTVALQKQLLNLFWTDISTLQHQQQSHSPCIQCWSNSRLLHPKISSLMRKLSRDSVQCHWGWRCCLESPHQELWCLPGFLKVWWVLEAEVGWSRMNASFDHAYGRCCYILKEDLYAYAQRRAEDLLLARPVPLESPDLVFCNKYLEFSRHKVWDKVK